MKKWVSIIISIGGTLAVGGLAAWMTRENQNLYSTIDMPPLSPPSIVFPIVWTVLYVLMALSVSIIYNSECKNREALIEIYIIQLVVNVIWPFIFFNWQLFLAAFVWLVLLWVVVLIMTILYFRCVKLAGWLLIPYLLWISFAGYLNFAIYLLNR